VNEAAFVKSALLESRLKPNRRCAPRIILATQRRFWNSSRVTVKTEVNCCYLLSGVPNSSFSFVVRRVTEFTTLSFCIPRVSIFPGFQTFSRNVRRSWDGGGRAKLGREAGLRPKQVPKFNVAGIEETVPDKGCHSGAVVGGPAGAAASDAWEPATGAERVRQESIAAPERVSRA
jgi:hypothetical protein